MLYKKNGSHSCDEEYEDDDSSLPPLLKRLPKDFGGGASIDYDDEFGSDDDAGDFGTMIVKTDRNRPRDRTQSSSRMPRSSPFPVSPTKRASGIGGAEEDDDEEGDGGAFSTFVVRSTVNSRDRESVSGTVVRRTGGGGGEGSREFHGSTMSRVVASMQVVGDLGFGKKKGNAGSQGDEGGGGRHGNKISSSSIPGGVTMEDPTTKYELLNELGKGSYGAVYKARDLKTSELVAIEVISLSEGEEGYEEIRGEIEMLQQCSHPNVVRYLGSFQGQEYLWIVMEYCGGGSVADLMNVTEEPLDEYQIAYICWEALKGLAYLHSIFKVHRDIKGGNILLTEQGDVKLGDFGVAAQLTRTMSKRNTFIGTPHWMAPEVAMMESDEETVDHLFAHCCFISHVWNLLARSYAVQIGKPPCLVDVWALGVSAIEMAESFKISVIIAGADGAFFQGPPPRSAVHPMRVLFMISIEPAPMLEDKEKWSLLFHDFVSKCLTKEPRLRPPAAELLKHKFIEKCKCGASIMSPKIEKARQIRNSMALQAQNLAPPLEDNTLVAPKVNEDYGDTVPSRPQNIGLQGANEVRVANTLRKQHLSEGNLFSTGNFGTVIVHGGDDIEKTASRKWMVNAEPSTSPVHDESTSFSGTGGKPVYPRADDTGGISNNALDGKSHPISQTLQASSPSLFGMADQTLRTKSISQGQVASVGMSTDTSKRETVSRKAFALQDKAVMMG